VLLHMTFLLQGLMRTMVVVVPGVLGQDATEMLLAEDRYVVQALAAQRAHEPLRECVRASNAASLSPVAGRQPVLVTFSLRPGWCPVNVAELL
jgi:hypothetical protein